MRPSALLARVVTIVAVTAPLASAAVLLPAGSAAASTSGPVAVAAVVEAADGRLSVVHGRASSLRRGQDLARRWRSDRRVVASGVVQPLRALATDPLRSQQWGLTRLSAEKAWQSGPASSQLVAVLDTGVDATHPDLEPVVVPGRDFVSTGNGTTDPHGHGTHVAGVVASVAANGVGGAGLAQGARILPVRVLDASGWGDDATVAEAILWSVDKGATVVNLSLGGTVPSSLLTAAIDYAVERDVVVVAASGNLGEEGDPVLYPAATPGVIAVGAIAQGDSHPAWSSTGSHLAVVAPGTSILSAVPGGGHASWSGTSMAAPFVSAAAALLNATEPALTPGQVRTRFMDTAQDLGPAGHDAVYGSGVVDVVAARAAGAPPVAALPVSAPRAPGPAPSLTPSERAGTPLVTVRTSRSAAVVLPHQAVTLAARVLADGVASGGAAVALERRVGSGPWTVVRSATTRPDGLVSFVLRPDRSGEHRFVSGSVVSSSLRVDVRQAVALTAARSGRLVKVDGKVLPGGASLVALQVPRGSGWATVAATRTDLGGRARFSVALPKGSRIRLYAPARPDLLAGLSPTLVR